MNWIMQPWPWWVSGILIGLTVPLLYILAGKAFGISTSLQEAGAMCARNSKWEYLAKFDRKKNFWTLVFIAITAQLTLANDQPLSERGSVYAKIILPVKSLREGSHPMVESWIAKKLLKRGKSDVRAVTHWVRLAEKGEEDTSVWNAVVDGKDWGCPVVGRVVERTEDGKVKVELLGWSPGGAEIKGQTLAAEIGRRKIAVVDTGQGDDSGIAYIALFVGPALSNMASTRK